MTPMNPSPAVKGFTFEIERGARAYTQFMNEPVIYQAEKLGWRVFRNGVEHAFAAGVQALLPVSDAVVEALMVGAETLSWRDDC